MRLSKVLWVGVLLVGVLLTFNIVGIFGPANQVTVDNAIGVLLIVASLYKLTRRR